jgi:hypothetical protein
MPKSITPERRVDMLLRQRRKIAETSWNAGAVLWQFLRDQCGLPRAGFAGFPAKRGNVVGVSLLQELRA